MVFSQVADKTIGANLWNPWLPNKKTARLRPCEPGGSLAR
jgi:hypothetical protein